MFEKLDMAPADPILGLSAAFKSDSNPQKINLGVGVYQDDDGKTPILPSVAEAEKRVVSSSTSKSYLAIDGTPEYNRAVQALLLGQDHEIIRSERAVTVQSPGGTGALRIAGDFISRHFPSARLWISQPTWANHPKIFQSAGIEVQTYPYFDSSNNGLDFSSMIETLATVPAGDVVLLHGCCHNPTGVDPTADQWEEVADLAHRAGWLPIVDFAYQGFGDSIEEDAAGLRALCRRSGTASASSFQKLWPLSRTDWRPNLRTTQRSRCAGTESFKNCRANKLFEPTCSRFGHRCRNLGRRIPSCAVGRRSGRNAGPDQWNAPTLCRYVGSEGSAERFFVYRPPARHVLLFGTSDEQVERLREEYFDIVGGGRINVAGMTTPIGRAMHRYCCCALNQKYPLPVDAVRRPVNYFPILYELAV